MTNSREQILSELINEVKNWEFSLACWEGGAAANGRLDTYSDIDLIICVEDSRVEEAFNNLKTRIDTFAKIEHYWRVPEPTWNGYSQSYYKLADSPDYFFLDIVVVKETSVSKPLEVERHGRPVIHFDRQQIVTSISSDTIEFWKTMRTRFLNIEASYPFYKAIVLKELQRQRALDALAFYRHLLNFYIELLGMKYRPFRYDFGLRYSSFEFPEDICQSIEKFSFVSGLQNIQNNMPLIDSEIDRKSVV